MLIKNIYWLFELHIIACSIIVICGCDRNNESLTFDDNDRILSSIESVEYMLAPRTSDIVIQAIFVELHRDLLRIHESSKPASNLITRVVYDAGADKLMIYGISPSKSFAHLAIFADDGNKIYVQAMDSVDTLAQISRSEDYVYFIFWYSDLHAAELIDAIRANSDKELEVMLTFTEGTPLRRRSKILFIKDAKTLDGLN